MFPSLLIGTGSFWVFHNAGPLMVAGEISPFPAAALFFGGLAGLSALSAIAEGGAKLSGWAAARTPAGVKGTAGFAKSLRELGKDNKRRGGGSYWGAVRGRELVADFSSVAATVGTSGSSKSTAIVEPNALSIPWSKGLTDFKGSLTVKLAPALRKRGERVRVLNFANAFPDLVGPTDQYNPTSVISRCYLSEGGLREVGEILDEMAFELLPEPETAGSGGTDNSYFRNASRFLDHWAIETVTLIHGSHATMADALTLLNDQDAALRHAQWACGELEVEPPEQAAEPDNPASVFEGGEDDQVYN
ncbi:MAG: type IV secretory system conjugative DNA transfer family protein [Pseudomonadota bacterium]